MSSVWMHRCKGKLTSLEKAIGRIKPGKRIYLSDGSATPLGLIPGLIDPQAALGDNEIIHLLTLGDAPYVRPEFAANFRHNALFIGANVREAVRDGRADYTPVFLSEIPALIRSGRLPIDVALIAVTPPDENGYCSFGTHVDLAPAVVEVADVIIAEVNPLMPLVPSPARIHVDDIDAMVLAEHPLPELPPPAKNDVVDAIGLNVADLIPNGATLQIGIGAVPNAILGCLFDHKDLGIHSELISDGVMKLAQRGVINGEKKTLNRGKIISSFVMGTQACYDFVRDNRHVELHPVDYTNDVVVIAQHDNMIAINTSLEVDLTGQVCSDSIGERFYSGIGGQVDFIRGAARSKGGKPIIAMPSTAQSGTISRIVPRLDRGAGVVTTRGDVHWVVTEWGAVNLHGLNVRERAMALISIAHPKFRPWLLYEFGNDGAVFRSDRSANDLNATRQLTILDVAYEMDSVDITMAFQRWERVLDFDVSSGFPELIWSVPESRMDAIMHLEREGDAIRCRVGRSTHSVLPMFDATYSGSGLLTMSATPETDFAGEFQAHIVGEETVTEDRYGDVQSPFTTAAQLDFRIIFNEFGRLETVDDLTSFGQIDRNYHSSAARDRFTLRGRVESDAVIRDISYRPGEVRFQIWRQRHQVLDNTFGEYAHDDLAIDAAVTLTRVGDIIRCDVERRSEQVIAHIDHAMPFVRRVVLVASGEAVPVSGSN